MNFIGAQDSALGKNLLLLHAEGRALHRLAALILLILTASEFLDLLADAHTAPVMTTHGAEIRINIKVLIVIRTSGVWIKAQFKVLLPIQCCASLGEFIVAIARARNTKRYIRCMSGDFVSNTPLFHVILLGKPQVFLGRHVAQHAGSVITSGGGANATGNVVVARKDVRDERPKNIERRAMAQRALQFHVEFNLIERHVPRTLNHHLHAHAPSALSQLADRFQFRQLRAVRGISQSAGSKAIAN